MNDNIDQTLAHRRELRRIIAADAHKAREPAGWTWIETIAVIALVAALAIVWAAVYVERVL